MLKKIFGWTITLSISLILIFSALLAGAVSALLEEIYYDLPAVSMPDLEAAVHTRILDRNGNLLEEVGVRSARKKLIRLVHIPRHVPEAFISIEDERFFRHFGIDFYRIGGALLIDLKKGKFAHGASTITQQLIRNVYLSPEKTVTRKIREMILSLKMEYLFTKHEILEMYLNTVYFGGSNYGIESAAQNYFGKSATELSIAESALLAGTLKAPNRYAPDRNLERGLKRQKIVLFKMHQLGFISSGEYAEAKKQKIVIKRAVEIEGEENPAPYFTQVVRRELVALFGKEKVFQGGLRVFTTLDPVVHEQAKKAFHSASLFKTFPLSTTPDLQGALVVRSVKNGDVLALIGGRDFELNKYNRATQSRRQPGSCFKPLVYAAAFEKGIPPNTIINDEPLSYYISQERKEWNPENYGGIYHGPTILRTALEHSYNMVAIKLLEKAGIPETIRLAEKMGIHSYLRPNLSLALGSSEVTPLELVSAYSTFANEGIYVAPRFILKVEDSKGNILYKASRKEREALSSKSAFKVFSMLQSVVQKGSGVRARVKGLPIGGKTGTNQDYIDAWFVGTTPDISAVVSFGYNDRKSLGKKTPSSQIAAPVIGQFFRGLKLQAPEHFQTELKDIQPEGLSKEKICRVSGLRALPVCPNASLEIFEEKNVPSVNCPIHGVEENTIPYLD